MYYIKVMGDVNYFVVFKGEYDYDIINVESWRMYIFIIYYKIIKLLIFVFLKNLYL